MILFFFENRSKLIESCFEYENEKRPNFKEIHKFLREHFIENINNNLNNEFIKPNIIVEKKMPLKQLIMFKIKRYKWIFLLFIMLLCLATLLPFIVIKSRGN
jgi:hypothetical protein